LCYVQVRYNEHRYIEMYGCTRQLGRVRAYFLFLKATENSLVMSKL